MTDRNYTANLRIPTKEDPLRIMISACLIGVTCRFDGSANGEYPSALKLLKYSTVKITRFCPEEFAFSTPREMCDIHGGTGMEILNGSEKVLTEMARTGPMV